MERDLIGVGAGPANLSLASLLATARERGLTSITATIFEITPTDYVEVNLRPDELRATVDRDRQSRRTPDRMLDLQSLGGR